MPGKIPPEIAGDGVYDEDHLPVAASDPFNLTRPLANMTLTSSTPSTPRASTSSSTPRRVSFAQSNTYLGRDRVSGRASPENQSQALSLLTMSVLA